MYQPRLAVPGLVGIAILMSACSPTETSTSPSTSTEVPFQSGGLVGATSGPVGAAVTTTGSGATITGLTGRFVRLSYQGDATQPVITTPVYYHAFSLTDLADHIWRVNLDGTDPQQITFDSLGQRDPAVDPATGRIAFWQVFDATASPPAGTLSFMQADGSGITPVRTEDCVNHAIRWAPNGNLLYGLNCPGAEGVYEIATDGSGQLKVFDAPFRGMGVSNAASGQFALVARTPTDPDSVSSIYRINYPARDTASFIPGGSADLYSEPRVSPVAPYRLTYWSLDTNVYSLRIAPLSDPANYRIIQEVPAASISAFPCHEWAPDGNSIVWSVNHPSGGNQLQVMDTLGQRIGFSLTGQDGVGCPAVGRPDTLSAGGGGTVVLIGDEGVLGADASGVIFGQGAGGTIRSVVAFKATPQRSVKLETGTGLNSTAPVLTYTLQANQVTSLKYTALPTGDTVFSAIDSGTVGATGALISFDAATGAVALILPFSTNLAGPAISDEGGVRTFRGHFLGAYRGNGENVAIGGATAVGLNFRGPKIKVVVDGKPRP